MKLCVVWTPQLFSDNKKCFDGYKIVLRGFSSGAYTWWDLKNMTKPSVVISANTAWNIYNFRKELIIALQAEGYNIFFVSPSDDSVPHLKAMGCEHVPIVMVSSGTSPVHDMKLCWSYRKILKKIKPEVYLGYTIKPNIYGSIAAHMTSTPTINNISGLGTVFIKKSWITRVVRFLYKLALSRAGIVFFQNSDDQAEFVAESLVEEEKCRCLPGSGIDLEHFSSSRRVSTGEKRQFLLIARLLWDKGIREYVEAAKIVKSQFPSIRFKILGFLGVDNRTSVPKEAVENWVEKGLIEYLGSTSDIRPFIEDVDCVVLPSYREGTPRSLLEAAALSRPIITTDVPGCRQTIDDEVSGFLCQVRDSADLAAKMIQYLELSPDEQRAMGDMGRKKMENEYAVSIVVESYLEAIDDVRRK